MFSSWNTAILGAIAAFMIAKYITALSPPVGIALSIIFSFTLKQYEKEISDFIDKEKKRVQMKYFRRFA